MTIDNAHWPTELIEATGDMAGFSSRDETGRQLTAWQERMWADYSASRDEDADHEEAVGYAVANLAFGLSRHFDMAAAANVAVELAAHTNLGKVEA